jgi:hypothetical protein
LLAASAWLIVHISATAAAPRKITWNEVFTSNTFLCPLTFILNPLGSTAWISDAPTAD